MTIDYNYDIRTQFKYVTLNSTGAIKDIYERIGKNDVFGVVDMMDNNDTEVECAIKEYNTQTHKVKGRPNKPRNNMPAYITEKLPRNKQQYINEVELFFLFGKEPTWKLEDGDAMVLSSFNRFMRKFRIYGLLRKAKRLAGAETESAIIFNLTRNTDGTINIKPFVAARSLGYKLRPMFDQYGDLIALAYGYRIRKGGKNELHYDILTKDFTFLCTKGEKGWEVETYDNPTGKINALYFKQKKAWDGAVERIHREEMLDSKVGDTNNYFADPKAAATADVIANISDPEVAGNMVQLTGAGSKFEYINPPQNSVTRQDEKLDLHKSIFFDTFTPDLSYESIKGLGTLSGAAMHNALILGYMKRDILREIYEPMLDRMRSVIFEILRLTEPKIAGKLDDTLLTCELTDPFATNMDNWDAIMKLYAAGLCSLETAIKKIALAENVDEEIDRIKMNAMELEFVRNEAKNEGQQNQQEEEE
ncbi:MAG: phage portal protein [Prevotella sp.]|nr:phage portal protein [Candidatus Prevotella equi]